jgi:nitrate/nitrite transport system substrate-binding protein
MTGTFEYESKISRTRFPQRIFSATTRPTHTHSDAIWFLTQMRHWGQIPEGKTRQLVRLIPQRKSIVIDIYAQAANALIA